MGDNILTPLMLFYKIFFTHPMIYTMFFLVLQFLMAGIWACVCLSVSFLSDYKIVVLIFPFFVQLILHVICTITNHIDYSSVYWVQPGTWNRRMVDSSGFNGDWNSSNVLCIYEKRGEGR